MTMTHDRMMTGSERMRAASPLQPVDATPVWFMRRAGRSVLPQTRIADLQRPFAFVCEGSRKSTRHTG